MNHLHRAAAAALTAATILWLLNSVALAESARQRRMVAHGPLQAEDVASLPASPRARSRPIREALRGYDNRTNGYLPQGPAYESLNAENVVPLRSFNDDRFVFEEVETRADGLGPTYNGQSCRECHENMATGGASQVTVHRTGRLEGDQFFESAGGSLIHSRAIDPAIQERVQADDTVRTFRLSTSTLGDGYVECVANETLLALRDAQPPATRGTAIAVSVLEAGGTSRIGRFGWKCQHASLESFAADAYLNEMGITSPIFPEENRAGNTFVGFGSRFDLLSEPEDDGEDLVAFADFIRATKAPPRGAINAEVIAGERLFHQVGCDACHTPTLVTARAGSIINGGTFVVPEALGDKAFHPYSDYLLHDIGTGDGIPVLPTAEFAATSRQIRTAPLWGLRTRNRLMHDGQSFTYAEAIQRHEGQAAATTVAYNNLSAAEQTRLLAFLGSL